MRRPPSCQPLLPGLALACLALAASAASANEAVYQRVVRSTVLIYTPSHSIGAGTLIDRDQRLVVTANHVPGKDDKVIVFFAEMNADGQPIADLEHYTRNGARLAIQGTVIAREARCDLALIRLETLPDRAVALPLAAEPRPGQAVHAIGHSTIKRNVVFSYSSDGVVRNVYNLEASPKLKLQGRIVETSLPTNKGDSGGPVVNDKGELVAVVSVGTTGAGTAADDAFANEQVVDLDIAVTEVRKLIGIAGNADPGTPRFQRPVAALGMENPGLSPQARLRLAALEAPPPPGAVLPGDHPAASAPPPPRSYLDRLAEGEEAASPPPLPPVSLVGGRWVDMKPQEDGFRNTWTFDANGRFRCTRTNAAGATQLHLGKYDFLTASRMLILHYETCSIPLSITSLREDQVSLRMGATTYDWRHQP